MVGGCGGLLEPGGSMWDEGGEGQRDGRQVVGGGAAGRVCVFVYFSGFGPEQRRVGVGLFPVPCGGGAPGSERWPCTWVLRGSCGSSIALAVT